MPRGLPVLAVVVCSLARPAGAQSNAEVNAAVQFDFRPPGARSLGLAGAFVAVADDATAAYANPAGLAVLTRPEVSLELRHSDLVSTYTDRGNAGTPSGLGVDNVAGLVGGHSTAPSSDLAFASVVYPSGRFAVAVYLHTLSRFRAAFRAQGAFVDAGRRAFPTDNALELDIANYGLSASYRASDELWLGAGASLYSFELDSRTDRFWNGAFGDTGVGGFNGPPDYSLGNLVNFQTQAGDDTAVDVTVGLLWRPTPRVQLGAVYRGGPEFTGVAVENRPGPSPSFTPTRLESGFKVPDSVSLGVAFRPGDRLLISAEAVRVLYSQRLESFVDAFGGTGMGDPADYAVDDGTELRAGVEYVVGHMTRPIVFRGGVWLEPDSRIRWAGPPDTGDATPILFRSGESVVHAAFGIGWVASPRFQIDAAGDLSDRSDTWTVSGVLRF